MLRHFLAQAASAARSNHSGRPPPRRVHVHCWQRTCLGFKNIHTVPARRVDCATRRDCHFPGLLIILSSLRVVVIMEAVTIVGLAASLVQLVETTTKTLSVLNDIRNAPKERVELAQ